MALAPAPRARGEARSFGSVALGGLALAAVIVAVAAALYIRFIRYERLAVRHVPPGSVLAIRLDVQQAILYDPVRRHLLPLLGGPGRLPAQGDSRLAHVETITGIRRGDLREIVLSRGAARTDWVIVLAGLFPRDVGANLLGAALSGSGEAWSLSSDGRAVVGPGGVAVGRAEDGAVLVASSEAEFRAARPQTSTFVELGLEARGPGSFAFGADVLGELRRTPWILAEGDLPAMLERLTRVRGVVTLGDRVGLNLISEGTGSEAIARRELEMLRAFGHSGVTPPAVLARGAADRARVTAVGAGSASLELAWEREEVDRAFALLAETIRARFQ